MLEIVNTNSFEETRVVEEIEVKVTIRLVDGEPDNEVSKALAPLLPAKEEETEPSEIQDYNQEDI